MNIKNMLGKYNMKLILLFIIFLFNISIEASDKKLITIKSPIKKFQIINKDTLNVEVLMMAAKYKSSIKNQKCFIESIETKKMVELKINPKSMTIEQCKKI